MTNLRYLRTFYTVFPDRIPEIRHIGCGEFKESGKRHTQSGVLDAMALAVEQTGAERGFSPNLGWLHYHDAVKVKKYVPTHFPKRDGGPWLGCA